MKEWLQQHRTPVILGGVWMLFWADWSAWYFSPTILLWLVFTAFAAGIWIWWFRWAKKQNFTKVQQRWALVPVVLLSWQWVVFSSSELGLRLVTKFATLGGLIVLFGAGLATAVWYVEKWSRAYAAQARAVTGGVDRTLPDQRIWNLANLEAWYFRRKARKLDQSGWTFVLYSLIFILLFLILSNLPGCREIYEMPAGGGEQAQLQVVKIQKVVKKKLVINPFSSIIFNPPPIEDIKMQFEKLTKHAYQVGYGQGEGSGFSGGTNRGKVRFIRIEYAGGDWDQDFGVGSDLNMLLEYGIRTGHKINDKTESRTIGQLKNFPVGKSPPFLYMTGQRNISMSNSDIEVLREYITDKHGMIFGDNGGSRGWHSQFFAMMQKVLPKVKPVRVPLDHPIHTTPYQIPFLPYVAPHGGKDAWGWVVDGRLVAYYHPGDIGDAWADGHAGVKREIWEYCYQLGTNVIFYSHVEYNKWLDSQNKDSDKAGKSDAGKASSSED
ncbi:MAG: DUF4159 domain-containing protein [Verrucomicrobiales bacterium]|nr:DUF4159 domain-containing protein [Verrucomicrobiales bacterium]